MHSDMQLFVSESHDPYANLAFEESLLNGRGSAAFLWINGPCVIIGRNQVPEQEADLTFMEANGIALVRRISGGGAVFHDLGNLNFSLITDDSDLGSLARWALAALASIGIDAHQNERNDILVGSRKVCGMAECNWGKRRLQHGTMMVSVDLDTLELTLRPHPSKLARHGIASVRARVANLTEISPQLTVGKLADAFASVLGAPARPAHFDESVLANAATFRSPSWLFEGLPR